MHIFLTIKHIFANVIASARKFKMIFLGLIATTFPFIQKHKLPKLLHSPLLGSWFEHERKIPLGLKTIYIF